VPLLLLNLDRLNSNSLTMTQELIAHNLGVRREGVSGAAGQLQMAGLIRYRRGKISVLDRAGLEKRSCECYAVVKKEYDRLLPHVAAPAREPQRWTAGGAAAPDYRPAAGMYGAR